MVSCQVRTGVLPIVTSVLRWEFSWCGQQFYNNAQPDTNVLLYPLGSSNSIHCNVSYVWMWHKSSLCNVLGNTLKYGYTINPHYIYHYIYPTPWILIQQFLVNINVVESKYPIMSHECKGNVLLFANMSPNLRLQK